VDNNQGKGFGARFGLDLLPIDYQMGRFHVSVSTQDGTWDARVVKSGNNKPGDDLWYTSWGIAADYQKLPFELRGEYLSSTRNMGPLPDDKREGWYLEGSYLLSRLPVDYLNRMELVARWSAVNQNAIVPDDSFTAFTRKPREIALGLDYWLGPKQVVKLEYKRVMQHEARDFNAILTSFAYGF
jgi:predicted porin